MACIEELVNQLVDRTSPIHPQSVRGLIQDVLIMGTPLSPDAELFSSARSVVSGRFINWEGISKRKKPRSGCLVSLADITATRPRRDCHVPACPRESRFSTHTRPLLWTRYPPHFIFHHPSSTTSFDSTRSGARRQQDRSERFTGGQFSEGSLHLESPVSHTSHVGRTDGRIDGQTDRHPSSRAGCEHAAIRQPRLENSRFESLASIHHT